MFEASNGIKIDAPDNLYMTWEWRHGVNDLGFASESSVGSAVAEFFQARRDEELGRWRSKENPDYIVYPQKRIGVSGRGRVIQVHDERTNRTWDAVEESVKSPLKTGTHNDVAREWFAAHPVPKPNYLEQFKALEVGTQFFTSGSEKFVKTGDNQMVRINTTGSTLTPTKYFPDVLSQFSHWKIHHDEITVLYF